MPTPSHWPMSWNSSTHMASPSRASSVTSGPVIAGMSPPTRSSSPCATGESAAASSRASRTSALPLAYCSQQPRLPHSQRCPPGTTCMWPNSPATPYRRARSRRRTTIAPPIPVPSVTQTRWSSPRPGAEPPLGPGRRVGVVLDAHRQAAMRRLAARRAAARRARPGGGRTAPRAVGVDETGRADPDRVDSWPVGEPTTSRRWCPRRPCALLPGVSRVTVASTRLLVDHAAGDLGAADVDADREPGGDPGVLRIPRRSGHPAPFPHGRTVRRRGRCRPTLRRYGGAARSPWQDTTVVGHVPADRPGPSETPGGGHRCPRARSPRPREAPTGRPMVTGEQRDRAPPRTARCSSTSTAGRMSFGDFRTGRARCGRARRRGVVAGQRVVWQLTTRIETLLITAALARLGAVQVPILPIYRGTRDRLRPGADRRAALPGRTPVAGHRPRRGGARRRRPGTRVVVVDGDGAGRRSCHPASAPAATAARRATGAVDLLHFRHHGRSQRRDAHRRLGARRGARPGRGAAADARRPGGHGLPDRAHRWLRGVVRHQPAQRLHPVFVEYVDPGPTLELVRREHVTLAGTGPAFHQTYLDAQRARPGGRLFPDVRVYACGGTSKPATHHDTVLRRARVRR